VNHNKAAKKHLNQLLAIVESSDVREVELDAEADHAERFDSGYWVEHVPTGRQTYILKLVVQRSEVDS
jgi:hypothetical protein